MPRAHVPTFTRAGRCKVCGWKVYRRADYKRPCVGCWVDRYRTLTKLLRLQQKLDAWQTAEVNK